MKYDCIIVGAGPAGISAAIQLKRAGNNVALIEKKQIGGLLRNANFVENYLGHKGISGKKLIGIFKKHLALQDIPIFRDEIKEVSREEEGFVLLGRENFFSKTLIIATGTKPKKIRFKGRKIFYEIADLPSYRSYKKILIIGGGDVAFDYALNLSEKGHKPEIYSRGEIKCLSLLRNRAESKGIKYFENFKIDRKLAEEFDLVLIAAGRSPNLPKIKVKNKTGLYLAGDVRNKIYRQVQIAAADGLKAAMEVIFYLKGRK